MLVEIADPADRADDVRGFVHDDDGGGAKAGAKRLQPVEIHLRVHDLGGGHQRHRRSAGDDRKQIVPAAANTARMLVDQLAEGRAEERRVGEAWVSTCRTRLSPYP